MARWRSVPVLMSAVWLASAICLAQEKPAGEPPGKGEKASPDAASAEREVRAAAVREAGLPGEMQKKFEVLAGEWDASVKFNIPGTNAPVESSGRMTNVMEMDGRYLRTTYRGKTGSQVFEGSGIWAYNNLEKKYESVWIDSESTGILWLSGTVSEDGRTFTLTGEAIDPATRQKTRHKWIVTSISDDAYTMGFYSARGEEQETKTMSISFTRVKDDQPAAEGHAGKAGSAGSPTGGKKPIESDAAGKPRN
ncbi:MAG: DUF1579 family protein [Phycisphaeraceae bacterium]|nr:DUF1579 family protein [Phycisphaeraceae bacterium]